METVSFPQRKLSGIFKHYGGVKELQADALPVQLCPSECFVPEEVCIGLTYFSSHTVLVWDDIITTTPHNLNTIGYIDTTAAITS